MIYSNDKMYIALLSDVLDLKAAFDFINMPQCGANSIFVGTTRDYELDESDRRIPINGLHYEAYKPMAFKQMISVVSEAMKNNEEIKRCFLVHRFGEVKNGEASIIIATCSKGRHDCTEATRRILCEIKKKVPIFKKILFQNDSNNDRMETLLVDNDPQQVLLNTDWIMKSEAFWLNN